MLKCLQFVSILICIFVIHVCPSVNLLSSLTFFCTYFQTGEHFLHHPWNPHLLHAVLSQSVSSGLGLHVTHLIKQVSIFSTTVGMNTCIVQSCGSVCSGMMLCIVHLTKQLCLSRFQSVSVVLWLSVSLNVICEILCITLMETLQIIASADMHFLYFVISSFM